MGEGRGDSAAKWAQLGGAVGGVAGMVYGWVVSTEVKTAKHALEAFTWGGGGALCGAAVGGLVGLLLGRRSAVQGLITRPLPVLNPEFTDRDEDLGWLRSGAPVAGRSSPVVQVLAGLSGTGKSQIAGRYLQEQDAAGASLPRVGQGQWGQPESAQASVARQRRSVVRHLFRAGLRLV